MKYPKRKYFTEAEKAEMWDRWQKGESLNSIARHFGRSHSSIQGVFAPTGGIRPPPSTDPPPTAPPARCWHALTDNGSENTATSKLFMLGGDGADAKTLADFWYYTVESEEWVLAPTGKSKPGKRKHAGLSCGAGECVTANGSNGISLIEETWIYAEVPGTWSKINCRKELCPSARMMVTMAYDPGRFYHLLFGGLGRQGNLDDTYSFAGGAWMREEPADQPAARRSAAMAYVSSPVNGIVLHGGQEENVSTLCDIWTWNGDNWQLPPELPRRVCTATIWRGTGRD